MFIGKQKLTVWMEWIGAGKFPAKCQSSYSAISFLLLIWQRWNEGSMKILPDSSQAKSPVTGDLIQCGISLDRLPIWPALH